MPTRLFSILSEYNRNLHLYNYVYRSQPEETYTIYIILVKVLGCKTREELVEVTVDSVT